MEYDIIRAFSDDLFETSAELKKKVSERCKVGWEPIGGVSFVIEKDKCFPYRAFQAMIRKPR